MMDKRLFAGLLAMVCALVILLASVWRHSISVQAVLSSRQQDLKVRQAMNDVMKKHSLYEHNWPRYQTFRQQGVIGSSLSSTLANLDTVEQSFPVSDWHYSWSLNQKSEDSDFLLWTLQIKFITEDIEVIARVLDALGSSGSGVLQPQSCLLHQVKSRVSVECQLRGAALSLPDKEPGDTVAGFFSS